MKITLPCAGTRQRPPLCHVGAHGKELTGGPCGPHAVRYFAVCRHTAKGRSLPCACTRQRPNRPPTGPCRLPSVTRNTCAGWLPCALLCSVHYVDFAVCLIPPCAFLFSVPCVFICRVQHTANIHFAVCLDILHTANILHMANIQFPVVLVQYKMKTFYFRPFLKLIVSCQD